ncbi:MAG: hypothetical protein RBR59_08345 [Sulfurimonadaceae bacterium]|jgi:outer membrane protein|nr:hypothetical protein [Sulfurimonadaceae bacterium]
MKYIFLVFFLVIQTFANEDYTLRVGAGVATNSDYGEVLMGNIQGHTGNPKVYALDGGYLLEKNIFGWPVDLYLYGGTAYFDEGYLGKNAYEATLYFKLYYNFIDEYFRFGFGEGGSYTSRILYTEYESAERRSDNNSHYLNYLDTTLDFDLGKVSKLQFFDKTYVGFLIKHRSGVFGLIKNVKKGGSNYNCFYIEKKF